MLDISSIPPERRFPTGLDRVLPALTRGLQHLGLDFFLVGAVARDLWLDTALDTALDAAPDDGRGPGRAHPA